MEKGKKKGESLERREETRGGHDEEISNDGDNEEASDNEANDRCEASGGGRPVAQGGGISKEERRGNVRRSKEAVARDPRDRQSQLAQVAGLCPLTQPTISNYVSPRERIYSRQGRLGREIPILLHGAPSCEETSINAYIRICIYTYIQDFVTLLSRTNIQFLNNR